MFLAPGCQSIVRVGTANGSRIGCGPMVLSSILSQHTNLPTHGWVLSLLSSCCGVQFLIGRPTTVPACGSSVGPPKTDYPVRLRTGTQIIGSEVRWRGRLIVNQEKAGSIPVAPAKMGRRVMVTG